MGKNKLKKFAEMETFPHVVQPSREELTEGRFDFKGNWLKKMFKNDHPIVLELGCGRGEYSVALAERFPEKNFIGIDIKGSRMWQGATQAIDKKLDNVAFLRIKIEDIAYCFGSGEVSEIWITFPDPQIKFRRRSKRLTHPDFLKKYHQFLQKDGRIHLKTDSAFLHGFTMGVIELENHEVIDASHDVYKMRKDNELLMNIKTYYEELFHSKGFPITYVQFRLNY
ncbi:MAG: tRNA (guanosine(46)-N7)-methyltransferase TrmB [Flavobacteriales bacterium]|jgi:tRNA (guanine-N7-)-methyltransferase|nr:tRNA (guanosine(46)-N7)-methyltransferase TrmB [Flavobacteriales bacterium]